MSAHAAPYVPATDVFAPAPVFPPMPGRHALRQAHSAPQPVAATARVNRLDGGAQPPLAASHTKGVKGDH